MEPQAELAAEWLRRADDDLRMAEFALSGQPPVHWGAAFHAEQAAEKLLKALLTSHGTEFARSHDIGYLLDLCEAIEPRTARLRATATGLTDFAVEARYPVPRREPTASEAGEAVDIARDVREVIHALLPPDIRGRTGAAGVV